MADSKKEQQKNRKKKQHKLKEPEGAPQNFLNALGEIPRISWRNIKKRKQKPQHNKYSKGVKYQNYNVNKNLKKGESEDRSLFLVWIIRLFYFVLVLGFIYIVDFEKFAKLRDGASYCLNKTVSFLPPTVVKQGEVAVEFIRPVAVITVNKLNVLLNDTSTFFNTNPLIKDHWTNIREISSICSARLVDYMRTLYVQTTGYCLDVKNKLF